MSGYYLHSTLVIVLCQGLMVAGDPTTTANAVTAGVPIWLVIVLGVVIFLLIIALASYIFRHRGVNRRNCVDIEQGEKRPSEGSVQTLVMSRAAPEKKQALDQEQDSPELSQSPNQDQNPHASVAAAAAPQPPQEIQIHLPMPPAWTSLFSDKMELNSDEDAEMFSQQLMNTKSEDRPHEDNNANGTRSSRVFDVDMPTMYAQAAASLQQKAAFFKSNLRQSLRRQRSSKGHTPIGRIFEQKLAFSDSNKDLSTTDLSIHPLGSTSISTALLPSESSSRGHTLPVIDSTLTDTTNTTMVAQSSPVSRTSSCVSLGKLIDNETPPPPPIPAPILTPTMIDAKSFHTSQMFSSTSGSEEPVDPVRKRIRVGSIDGSSHRFSVQSRDLDHLALTSSEQLTNSKRSSVCGTLSRRPLGPAVQDIIGWWQKNESVMPTPPSPVATSSSGSVRRTSQLLSRRSSMVATSTTAAAIANSAASGKIQLTPLDEWIFQQDGKMQKRASTVGRHAMAASSMGNSTVKSLRSLFDQPPLISSRNSIDQDSQKTQLSPPPRPPRMLISPSLANQDESSTKIALPDSPFFTTHAEEPQQHDGIDTIRQALQETWQANMKESSSLASIQAGSTDQLSTLARDPADLDPVADKAGSQDPRVQEVKTNGGNIRQPRQGNGSPMPWMEDVNASSPGMDRRVHSGMHSRKSSGDTSTQTVLCLANANHSASHTWNGRVGKDRKSLLEVTGHQDPISASKHTLPSAQDAAGVPGSPKNNSKSHHPKAFFSTMRYKQRHQRGSLPVWSAENDTTPAQQERDRYMHQHNTSRQDQSGQTPPQETGDGSDRFPPQQP